MFQKTKTLKVRISLLSFLIMILTVVGIMTTEFILQRNLGTIQFNMSTLEKKVDFDDKKSLDDEVIIQQTKKFFQQQQRLKFIWLVSISSVILLVGIYSIYQIIKKELSPLEKLKNTMDEMTFDNSEPKQLEENDGAEEIISLTNSYNVMIEKLRESYDLQKRFSQNAAHELRTPITTMKTSLQVHKLVKASSNNNEKLLVVLEDQVSRMEQLIKCLSLINNKAQLEYKEVSVRGIIEELFKSYEAQLNKKHIVTSIDDEVVLYTDPTVLTVVLKNLIENAIRYNKEGGSISVHLSSVIQITDSGIGIPKEEVSRIFSPFYCVDTSRSREYGGMGLGLSIVQNSIERLGYKIHVFSEVGKGTMFEITTS